MVPCPLTQADREILDLFSRGHNRKSASGYLKLSTTAMNRRAVRLFARIGARSDAHAMAIAFRAGWLR